uniref:Retrotransposon protein, putative, Ty3-gypsy subclass n=1 Tax=Oryza sativa subsp. japonica TaxID=39947 RepID=Q2QXU7_ORYSJ|nr:retrotransposon protein, putative, Ty3-gypsy subclass [Oryza sativa Japonica Group]
MATEEGVEPSAPVAEDGGAPPASAPAPLLPSSAPIASLGQVPNTPDTMKAAAAARALQTRAEILSTSHLLAPQAAPSQPAMVSTALVAAQVNPDPETQAEADMEAMRQNMTRLQGMLRQMQEQQQAYEAARRAKAASAPILQYSAGYVPPQVYPQATQVPAYFVGQPSIAAVHPAPRGQPQAQPVTVQVHPQLPGQVSQAMAKGASTRQAQLQAFLQQLSQPRTQVRVRPVGCRRISQVWGLRLGVRDRSSTSSMLLRHQLFGRKHQRQASGRTKHQTRPPWRGPSQRSTHPWRLIKHHQLEPRSRTLWPNLTRKPLPRLSPRHIRNKFKFLPVPRYSGETDTKEFLSIYESAIEAAHGDENTKAKDITEASVINAASAGLLEGELTRKITNKEPQTLEHLLRIIDGYARGEEDSKRRQVIQVEYDKASVAAVQAQVQAQVSEPAPLAVRQSQPPVQGQPPRLGQAPMTWRKFRTDRAGKAVMAVEEVQALRKEFDAQQASSHQQPVRKKISFEPEDAEGVLFPHQDPLVISAEVAGFEVRRILVDGGSLADVIFAEAYAKMGLPTLALTQAPALLRGFGGEVVQVLGQVQLVVAFGISENRREEQILFDIVDIPYNYNAIFSRATLNKFEAISHHNYLKLTMPGPIGVIVVKGLQPSTLSKGDLVASRTVDNVEAEPHDHAKRMPKPAPHGKVIKMQVDDADPTKFVLLGGDLGEEEAEDILKGPDEVGGVSKDLIMHHLAVKPGAKPRKQKLRKMSADRQEAAKAEVQKLLKAGVIQEIDHPEWLANPVLVRKSNGKWRMCVDFTDLNKVCPKDDFPLPRIDQLVDSTAGCELMSFLDAYSSYHQIHMNPADIPKTAFITSFGTFCHLRMPFGLRNAGATFAKMVYKAYLDDIVVKSRKTLDHASDLQETFNNLRVAGMKLNPEKCVFGVRAGKLLGFLVSERGIEANPEKIDAIRQMKPPSSVREVQKLAGRIAAISRFLSKAAERGLPFFKTLRGAGKFSWTPECQVAFDELKQYLQNPPTLVSPTPGSEMLLYLAASPVAYPLGEVLWGKEITGRLSKWAAELSPFDLHFVTRTAIKSQVLADFVAEWTPAFAPEPESVEQPWVMHSDGSWSQKGAGAAAVLTSPGGVPIQYAARLQFGTTNNMAEYEAVLLGLRKAKELGVRCLLIRTDSKLVASHVDKSFEVKEEGMKKYLEAVRSMEKCFAGITVEHLPRGQNEEADALARSAACGGPHSPGIFFEVLYAPSVPAESLVILAIDQAELGEDAEDWRTPFVKYLKNGWLPEDEAEAKRLQLRATKYKLISGQLYRSGVLQPLLHCISFAEGEEMAKEIHQGLCGAHQAARTVASKVFRQGVYWPTVLKVCVEQAKKCESCQRHGRSQTAPQYELQPIAPVWPFARWGLDIVGPFPVARNGYKFAIVAIEYFSRWIEAEPLGPITSAAVQKFVWKNIVCRFGVPKEFITDNGKQFD